MNDDITSRIKAELDVSGWDVPKALELLRKSNPPLLEWIQSPILYQKTSSFLDRMKTLMGEYYSPISCLYHYLRRAEIDI